MSGVVTFLVVVIVVAFSSATGFRVRRGIRLCIGLRIRLSRRARFRCRFRYCLRLRRSHRFLAVFAARICALRPCCPYVWYCHVA